MKDRSVIIKASGEVTPVEPKNGKDFKLDELQAIVGGLIEIVYAKDGKILVINEEGKLHGLATNIEATRISGLWPHDVIVGDVLVTESRMVK